MWEMRMNGEMRHAQDLSHKTTSCAVLSFAPDGRNFVGEILFGRWTTDYKSFASKFSMSNKDFTL